MHKEQEYKLNNKGRKTHEFKVRKPFVQSKKISGYESGFVLPHRYLDKWQGTLSCLTEVGLPYMWWRNQQVQALN